MLCPRILPLATREKKSEPPLSASPPQDVVLFPLQRAFQFRTEALAFVSRDLRMFLLMQGEVTEKESPASFILMGILSLYL